MATITLTEWQALNTTLDVKDSALLYFVLAAGFLMTVLLVATIQLAQISWRRAKDFERVNWTLENEIVERKQAQEALVQSEKRFRDIAASSGDWFWEVDRKGRYTYASGKIKKNLGYSPEALMGKTPFDFMPPAEAERVKEIFTATLHEKSPIIDLEHWNITKNGDKVCSLINGVPLLNNQGEVIGYRGVAKDITGHKQAETEKEKLESRLQQVQHMEAVGTLAGGIAHDFNNILGAILGYANMAKEDSPQGSSVAKDLDKVLCAGERAKSLVKQILAFIRQDNTERIPLQPASIVKEVVKMLRPTLPTTIEINQNIDPQIGPILADPTQIHQIVMNLCTNAFHAMEEKGGRLDISLSETNLSSEDLKHEPNVKAGTFVQLSVCDSGPGIAPEIKNKIFDPYFTTKETGKGTGMGLSIIHGIVKSYGGFISLYSELGEGTAFHVFLPVIKKETLPASEDVGQVPTGEERILFIDDEEILTEIGKRTLERLGYHVTVRNSSLEALEIFQNQPDKFDLVITDQTMPGTTGADLAKKMMQIRPDIPIILCTGYSTIISEEQAKSMGIKEFALKPIAKRDMAELIRKALDAS